MVSHLRKREKGGMRRPNIPNSQHGDKANTGKNTTTRIKAHQGNSNMLFHGKRVNYKKKGKNSEHIDAEKYMKGEKGVKAVFSPP